MHSITISNRDQGLPPLLLPSLGGGPMAPAQSTSAPGSTGSTGSASPAQTGVPSRTATPDCGSKRRAATELDGRHSPAGSSSSSSTSTSSTSASSGLDSLASLASLATKRPRLGVQVPTGAAAQQLMPLHFPNSGSANGSGMAIGMAIGGPVRGMGRVLGGGPGAVVGAPPGTALGRAAAVAVAVAAGAGVSSSVHQALLGAAASASATASASASADADAQDTPPSELGGLAASSSAGSSRSATPLSSAGSTGASAGAGAGPTIISVSGSGASKRQRIGPSCDKCRLKKIKCDAHIEILAQDESVLAFASDRLHYALTKEDVERLQQELEQHYGVERETLAAFLGQSFQGFNAGRGANNKQFIHSMSIIKHIDKLVLFKPCLSCCKRKHSAIITSFGGEQDPYAEFLNCCTFSKGFTRADINVFAKIAHKQQRAKSIYEMDTTDYKTAGF